MQLLEYIGNNIPATIALFAVFVALGRLVQKVSDMETAQKVLFEKMDGLDKHVRNGLSSKAAEHDAQIAALAAVCRERHGHEGAPGHVV
jgi:hypothetical protein